MMKILKNLSVSLSIGFVLTSLFSLLFVGVNSLTAQILAWLIASILYGLSAFVFEIKVLNTLAVSIIHYVICFGITAVNIYLFYREYFVSVLISFTLSYALIYLVMWLVEKQKIAALNKKLSEKS